MQHNITMSDHICKWSDTVSDHCLKITFFSVPTIKYWQIISLYNIKLIYFAKKAPQHYHTCNCEWIIISPEKTYPLSKFCHWSNVNNYKLYNYKLLLCEAFNFQTNTAINCTNQSDVNMTPMLPLHVLQVAWQQPVV